MLCISIYMFFSYQLPHTHMLCNTQQYYKRLVKWDNKTKHKTPKKILYIICSVQWLMRHSLELFLILCLQALHVPLIVPTYSSSTKIKQILKNFSVRYILNSADSSFMAFSHPSTWKSFIAICKFNIFIFSIWLRFFLYLSQLRKSYMKENWEKRMLRFISINLC